MVPEAQDIHRAHRVTRDSGSALRTAVDPAVFAPLPAYGTRLRGIGFTDGNRASRLIIELPNDLARASRTHLLGLHASVALRGVVERLAHIARGTGERRSYRMRGLVGGMAHLALRLVEHLVFAALQPLPA